MNVFVTRIETGSQVNHFFACIARKNSLKFQKAYIGHGTGLDQEMDEQMIAAHGQKFPVEMAKARWPEYNFIT